MRFVGRYELVTRLASGHSGEIHLAHYSSLFLYGHDGVEDRAFALELLQPELARLAGFRAMLTRESRAALGLVHHALARVLEVGLNPNEPAFVAMELVLGQSLASLQLRAAADGRALSDQLLIWVAHEAASALRYAHHTPWAEGEDSPILHGSLSPQSLMVRFDGGASVLGVGTGRSKLTVPPSITTLAYRAPELIERTGTDRRADVYSLGLILYDGLSGQRSFKRRTLEETQSAVLIHGLVPLAKLRPDLDPELAAIVTAMVDPVRTNRPASMADVQAVLARALGASPADAAERVRAYLSDVFAAEHRAQRRMVDAMLHASASDGLGGVVPHAARSAGAAQGLGRGASPLSPFPQGVPPARGPAPPPMGSGGARAPDPADGLPIAEWSVRAATADLHVPRPAEGRGELLPPRSEWSVRSAPREDSGRGRDLDLIEERMTASPTPTPPGGAPVPSEPRVKEPLSRGPSDPTGELPEEELVRPVEGDDAADDGAVAPPIDDVLKRTTGEYPLRPAVPKVGPAPVATGPELASFPAAPGAGAPAVDIGAIALELFHRLGGHLEGSEPPRPPVPPVKE